MPTFHLEKLLRPGLEKPHLGLTTIDGTEVNEKLVQRLFGKRTVDSVSFSCKLADNPTHCVDKHCHECGYASTEIQLFIDRFLERLKKKYAMHAHPLSETLRKDPTKDALFREYAVYYWYRPEEKTTVRFSYEGGTITISKMV